MAKPDWEELVLQSMAEILLYKEEQFRFNPYQCINLCYVLVSKLSRLCTIKWQIESPTISFRLKRRRDTSSHLSDGKEVIPGAWNLNSRKEVIRGAWKEVYRAVMEAELYLESCCSHRWWTKSATLAFTGEAHAVHIHDLVWSFLSLDLNILFAQGISQDSYSADASRKIGDFLSEMSNLTRIYDEHADKKHLISTFHQLLRNYQEQDQTFQQLQQNCQQDEQTCETANKDVDKNKIGMAKFISAKLEAAIRVDSAITDSPVPAWLQIDPEDLTTNQRPIAQGSYGAVYEGSWLGLKVAVKEISVDAYDLFQTEAAVLGKLHSPFIVQLIGTCIKNDSCYLVMELIPSNLEAHIEERCAKVSGPPFPLHVAVDIMLQISRGMEYLHSRNVMHMDLKSSNVLIRPSAIPAFRNEGYCRVKLCDFGMAGLKLYSLRSSFPKGTCYWRAPEAFAFQQEELPWDSKTPKEYTYKADVYSFAMTSYEILTGKQPFEGVSPRDLYRKIIQDLRPHLPSSCPLPLAYYIKKCWHTDPSRRPCFQDVSKLLRYTKLLITRMKGQGLLEWVSSSLEFDRLQLGKCDNERFNGRVTIEEEKLIVRAMEGEFTPQSYNPSPGEHVTQWSSVGTRGIVLANILQYMQKFSYQEIQKCTDNFTREVSGVPSSMWKGVLENGRHVMVKAVNEVRDFYNELDILCLIHHPNIIRLRGFSANNGCYLVYDHMVMGPLRKQFYGRSRTTCLLNWPSRRNIILAIARSLAYIHGDCPRKLLNVSLNSNNIFLDERFTPKLSVFGTSIATDVSNISFAGHGEEFKNASEFGIIVLELLTGQRREDIFREGDSISDLLAGLRSHAFMDFIDHRMNNKEIEVEEARRLINLALWCLLNDPFERPSLRNLVSIIEGHSELPTLRSLDKTVNTMRFMPIL